MKLGTKRIFIALDLDSKTRESIYNIARKVQKEGLFSGKLTPPENFHLTLKFLGETDDEKLASVKQRLALIKMKSFSATIEHAGLFSPDFIRIIWLKLDGDEVIKLQKRIDDALDGLFKKEEQFMSHITIARPKAVKDKQKVIDYVSKLKFELINAKITSFSLMQSELAVGGSKYTVIERYELG